MPVDAARPAPSPVRVDTTVKPTTTAPVATPAPAPAATTGSAAPVATPVPNGASGFDATASKPSAVLLGGVTGPAPDVSGDLSRLNDTQRKALADATTRAATASQAAHAGLVARVARLGYSEADLTACLAYLKNTVPITINMDLDRSSHAAQAGLPANEPHVIDHMISSGHQCNTFELNNYWGASYGNTRDGWERTLFSGDYQVHPLVADERPKYGALNAVKNPSGGSPTHGNAFLILKSGVKERATFTPQDSSHCSADQVGTAGNMERVLLDVPADDSLRQVMDVALGRKESGAMPPYQYLEAQVHGPVDYSKDVAALVVGNHYRGTPYEEQIRRFSELTGVPVRWDTHAESSVYTFS
jgi:hypothetical protein